MALYEEGYIIFIFASKFGVNTGEYRYKFAYRLWKPLHANILGTFPLRCTINSQWTRFPLRNSSMSGPFSSLDLGGDRSRVVLELFIVQEQPGNVVCLVLETIDYRNLQYNPVIYYKMNVQAKLITTYEVRMGISWPFTKVPFASSPAPLEACGLKITHPKGIGFTTFMNTLQLVFFQRHYSSRRHGPLTFNPIISPTELYGPDGEADTPKARLLKELEWCRCAFVDLQKALQPSI